LLWSELTCGFIGILLLCRAWLTVCRTVRRDSEERTGRLAGLLAVWSVPLLIAPPMFSNDVYNYAAQGEMVSHHINPYLYGPGFWAPRRSPRCRKAFGSTPHLPTAPCSMVLTVVSCNSRAIAYSPRW